MGFNSVEGLYRTLRSPRVRVRNHQLAESCLRGLEDAEGLPIAITMIWVSFHGDGIISSAAALLVRGRELFIFRVSLVPPFLPVSGNKENPEDDLQAPKPTQACPPLEHAQPA